MDWYPWGPEALAMAREEGRPILLSIGYSACHWCHVMERESFEDPETAALMNHGFVNIKVDREERPDLDGVYMGAVQALTGRGGWPLTAFLTPDGKAFFGGTYFPPTPRQGMPSFREVLEAVLDAWRNRREEVEDSADRLLSLLNQPLRTDPPQGEEDTLEHALQALKARFDSRLGGFGPPPKFPQPTTLEFLLAYHKSTGNPQALEMVATTLRAMARGGIRDQLGGGFHRYSVDARWLVPHFEKMLYDNGLLARVYLHAFLLTGEEEFRRTTLSTLDYILEDLTGPEGGFYSSRDADSEGQEGIYYLWSSRELEIVLGDSQSRVIREVFGATPQGNFEGQNILHLHRGIPESAIALNLSVGELEVKVQEAKRALLKVRSHREAPFRDEKVLVSWNSFVLRALAEAGIALGRPEYLQAARRNARFLLAEVQDDGRLLRSWKDGPGKTPGFLEDYAGLGNALLTLHEATLEAEWLVEARQLLEKTEELFWEGGEEKFYDTARDGEALVTRPRDLPDGATPSGHSLAVEFFWRGSRFFGETRLGEIAATSMAREEGAMLRFPSAFGRLLATLQRERTLPLDLVIVGEPQVPDTQKLLTAAHVEFNPNRTILGGDPSGLPPLPLFQGRHLAGGLPTAYVCRGFTCSAPIQTEEELKTALRKA